MKIQLNTIANANNFVSICSKYYNADIDVKQGKQITSGKSILGIYSLDLLNAIFVTICTDNMKMVREFYSKIHEWEV